MNRAISRAIVALAGGMAGAVMAAQPLGCLIEPFRVADVGSPVIGVIDSLRVERGDRVIKGQPLATLRADVERVSVDVALSKSQAIGEFNAAEANYVLAQQKLVRAKDLADQQFISPQALEQARAETRVAEHRLAQAREQRTVFAREHVLAQAQLGLRTIRSPSTGVIADRYLSVGERVEEKPIYRVAVVDPLRVEVVMPAQMYGSLRLGQSLSVTPEFPNAGARWAKVVLVDKLIDGASNTFRVRLELPNADLSLPAGLRCKADVNAVPPPSAPAARIAAQPAEGRVGADALTLRSETRLSTAPSRKQP